MGLLLATEQKPLGSTHTFLKGKKVRTGTSQTQTKILKVKVLIYDSMGRKEVLQIQREPFQRERKGDAREAGSRAERSLEGLNTNAGRLAYEKHKLSRRKVRCRCTVPGRSSLHSDCYCVPLCPKREKASSAIKETPDT